MIRESESKLVSRLFIFEFFQGAAIALYFITSISIFVDHLPASELPKVFILSAFLLWLFGFLYSKIEHYLLTKQLVYFVLIFNGICIALFRIFIHWQDERWFLYIFLASFNIFYLFNNLEFWGLVSLLFDVRQSKRLFAIVSAWDGPSRMVGYGIAGVVAYAAGTGGTGIANLLWIAAFFMLLAVLLFIPLARSDEMKGLAPTHHHHYATQSLQHIQAALTGNKLIRNAALVSFFSFCFYLVTNFILYGYVKREFHSDKSLAGFFAIFLVISRGLALIVKPLFINRLLDQLGLRKSLLIAPVFLLVLSTISFFASGSHSSKPVFYLFMIMAVAVDILRSSIQSPVLLATLQPLPAQQRLRGHTIIKGLMDPFSFLATGGLLLAILSYNKELNFELLSALLFSITALWIYFAFSVDRNYINMLTAAIRKRTLDGRDISITDSDSLHFLLNRIQNGNEEEALSVLHLISSQPIGHEKFYREALHHKSPNVRKFVFELIQSQHYDSLLPELKQMLYGQPDTDNLQYLVRTIGAFDRAEDLSVYLQHENVDVANAAAMALLSHPDQTRQLIGRNHLLALFDSGQTHARVNALRMVGEMKVQQFSDHVHSLLLEKDEAIHYHALMTAGRLAAENLIHYLLSAYIDEEKDNDILEALRLAGEPAVAAIKQFLKTAQCSIEKRRRLFILLGKIGGHSSISLLQDCVQQFPGNSILLLSILYQLRFKCEEDNQLYKNLLHETLETATGNIFRLHYLSAEPEKHSMILHALELELTALKDTCLWLFSFLFDGEKIRRAKGGFDLNTKESMANSFELIEMTVPKEYAGPFILLFEQTDIAYKLGRLGKSHKEPAMYVQGLIKTILTTDAGKFNVWTKACVLYSFKNENHLLEEETVRPYIGSENLMLSEIAKMIAVSRNTVRHENSI